MGFFQFFCVFPFFLFPKMTGTDITTRIMIPVEYMLVLVRSDAAFTNVQQINHYDFIILTSPRLYQVVQASSSSISCRRSSSLLT